MYTLYHTQKNNSLDEHKYILGRFSTHSINVAPTKFKYLPVTW